MLSLAQLSPACCLIHFCNSLWQWLLYGSICIMFLYKLWIYLFSFTVTTMFTTYSTIHNWQHNSAFFIQFFAVCCVHTCVNSLHQFSPSVSTELTGLEKDQKQFGKTRKTRTTEVRGKKTPLIEISSAPSLLSRLLQSIQCLVWNNCIHQNISTYTKRLGLESAPC